MLGKRSATEAHPSYQLLGLLIASSDMLNDWPSQSRFGYVSATYEVFTTIKSWLIAMYFLEHIFVKADSLLC
jgi:hypothetical protein